MKVYIDSELEGLLQELLGECVEFWEDFSSVELAIFSESFDLERLKTEKDKNYQKILISRQENKEYLDLISSQIHPELFEQETFKNLFKSLVLNRGEFDFLDLQFEQEAKTCRVLSAFSVGSSADIIAADMFEANIEDMRFRLFLTNLFYQINRYKKESMAYFPVDLHYGMGPQGVVIQAYVQVSRHFDASQISPQFLSPVTKYTDFLSLSYLKNVRKLVVSAFWNPSLEQSTSLRSFFIDFKDLFEYHGNRPETIQTEIPRVIEESKTQDLTGGGFEENESVVRVEQEEKIAQKVIKVKRILEFTEDMIEDPENFTEDDLDQILLAHPDKTIGERLSSTDKNYVIDVVRGLANKDELDDECQKVVGEVDDDEFVKKVKSSLQDTDFDEIAKVTGAEEGEDGLIKINGNKEDLTSEVWTIKRAELEQKIDSKFKGLLSTNKSKGEIKRAIEHEIKDFIDEEFELDEDDKEGIAAHVVDEALSEFYKEKVAKVKEAQTHNQAELLDLQKEVEKLKQENHQFSQKNERLLNLVSSMKGQIKKMYDVERELADMEEGDESLGPDPQRKIDYLTLLVSQKEIKISQVEGNIEKIRKSYETQFQQKDKEIQRLNNRISDMTHRKSIGGQEDLRGEVNTLISENERLKMQLMKVQERMTQLSENFQDRIKKAMDKSQSEATLLKSDLAKQTNVLSDLSKIKDQMGKHLGAKDLEIQALKEEIKKLKSSAEELDSSDSQGESEQARHLEKQIENYKKELRSKDAELKASSLKFKQYDQKIRFLSAQLESRQGGGSTAGSEAAGKASSSQTAELAQMKHRVKQLTSSTARLEQAMAKLNSDLADKKKESVMMTQELNKLKKENGDLKRKANIKAAS